MTSASLGTIARTSEIAARLHWVWHYIAILNSTFLIPKCLVEARREYPLRRVQLPYLGAID